VPQRNPDFLQDPILGPILHYLQPNSISPPLQIPLYIIIPVAAGSSFILLASLAFCLYRCLRKAKQQDLGPSVRSGTFRVISTNLSMIELSNIRDNSNPPRNDYPLLN